MNIEVASVVRVMWFLIASVTLVTSGTGCGTLKSDAHLAAFSTQLTGINQVPPVGTSATGTAFAVLDKNTRLLRWKLQFSGLSSTITGASFHGPALIGANAISSIALRSPVKSPTEGQAILTPAQATDLLAGKWYLTIETSVHPGGEIRGQMILRE